MFKMECYSILTELMHSNNTKRNNNLKEKSPEKPISEEISME